MPGIDGLTLVRRLKADEETRDVHVIVVTSYPDRYTKKDALAAGCDAYLVKPISTRALPKIVSEVVAGHPKTES